MTKEKLYQSRPIYRVIIHEEGNKDVNLFDTLDDAKKLFNGAKSLNISVSLFKRMTYTYDVTLLEHYEATS